jgi:DNA-cytosine methyltransferase
VKKGGIVVLSLFDGMSCGRIALDRAGIKVKKYYASEIDKYAQIVSAANYPDIIRLGDITKWKTWKIEKPDLIIGGSPCQGFSFAGKGLNFNDPRSKLFFTFADIVKHYKPKYFLLENVKMKKEHQKVISDCLGVEPIEINSALVSAQNRKRLYWTNIPGVTQPKDKGILLKDIIDGQAFVNARGKVKKQTEKSNCIDANYHKGKDDHGQRTLILAGHADEIKGHGYNKRVYSPEGKSPSLAAASGGNLEPKIAIKLLDRSAHSNMCINKNIKSLHGQRTVVVTGGAFRGRNKENPSDRTPGIKTEQRLEINKTGKSNTLTSVSKDSLVTFDNPPHHNRFKQTATIHYKTEKSNTLLACAGDRTRGIGIHDDNLQWRKLTPVECERLQTVPDNFTAHVSNTQRYKMLGNGWTVDVIAHIFRGIK